jgi:predicted nucleic acid-binding Zn ribbon protein
VNGFTVYTPPKPEPARVGAVYILMRRSRCIYVGQTTNLDQRVLSHGARNLKKNRRRKRARTVFDRVLWISVALDDLKAYEGAIARALNPSDTKRVSSDTSRDAEVLAILGMQPDETHAFELRMAASQKAQGRRLKAVIRRQRAWRNERSAARVFAFIEAAA